MGDTLRQQQLATERLAQRLHAAHLVDGGTDDGEVETSRGTNVAVEDVAEMESDGQVESGPALGGAAGGWGPGPAACTDPGPPPPRRRRARRRWAPPGTLRGRHRRGTSRPRRCARRPRRRCIRDAD